MSSISNLFYLHLWLLFHCPCKTLIEPDVDSFITMVETNLSICANYTLPVNNEKLSYVLPTEEDEIYDFGIFDFIIVGAGSAGTLLANRLTEVNSWKVLLLEAGGDEDYFSDIPGMASNLQFSDMNWGYLTTPQKKCCKAMIQNQCPCPRGKVLGGSSTINAKMYARGNKEDYNTWEAMGNAGWSYKDVLPYFIKTENSHIDDGDIGFHGTEGLLSVNYTEVTLFNSVYIQGMEELGFQSLDYNGKNQIGVSKVQWTIKGNKIASGGRAFIDPFLSRKNLNVTLNSFVTNLVIETETKTVQGVNFIKDGRKYTVKADKEVILSAGAINTPQLLMISGIGPTEELDKIGVDTIADLPVGKSLEDHATFYALNFRTNQTLFNESLEVLLEKYLYDHRPFTAAFDVDAVGFLNVHNQESSVPNIQQILMVPPDTSFFKINVLNLKKPEFLTQPFNDIMIHLILLHPKSNGSVTLKSKDPQDFPNIDYNFYAEEEDVITMLKAINETLKLLETDAFKAVNATYAPALEVCTDFIEVSEEYWRCMIEHLTSTLYHPAGTTRMGRSSKNSVVSSKLLVHEMRKLRIVDAGVIPKITSGNINAPTYMIAEKAADFIKELHIPKIP